LCSARILPVVEAYPRRHVPQRQAAATCSRTALHSVARWHGAALGQRQALLLRPARCAEFLTTVSTGQSDGDGTSQSQSSVVTVSRA
jgi:hypothetical protein